MWLCLEQLRVGKIVGPFTNYNTNARAEGRWRGARTTCRPSPFLSQGVAFSGLQHTLGTH